MKPLGLAAVCIAIYLSSVGVAWSADEPAAAPAAGTSFSVSGERLELGIPAGWKLAWMEGGAEGGFIVEYIPQAEDIQSWREGYLAVQRMPYPSASLMAELKKANVKIADVALHQFMKKVEQTCGGRHQAMTQASNDYNGAHFAVSGGYCDQYGIAAPFGEGSVVAFVEGKEYWFRIQFGWRPNSESEQQANLPWRVSPQIVKDYVDTIRTASLCGGSGQAACKTVYAK